MKKIISICLSVILILGLMPQAFATVSENQVTVSTTETTTVEAEDYPYTKGTIQQTEGGAVTDATPLITVKNDDPSASEEEYLYSNLYSTTAFERTHYWEYKFVITQDGDYKIKTRVGKPWIYRMGGLYVTFEDTTIASITNKTTGNAVEWGVFEKEIPLTAGTYTFKVETDEGTGGNHQLFVDYVSVEYVPEVVTQVGGNGIRIEVEDYPKILRTVGENTVKIDANVITEAGSDFSNDKYLKYNAQVSGEVPTTLWEHKVNISTAGLYDIKYKVRKNNNWEGNLTLLIDGETVASVAEGTAGWELVKTSKMLTAGNHTVGIKSYRGNVNAMIYADYIELSPGGVVDVSSSAETIIEAEDYAYSFLDNNGTVTFHTGTVKNDIATASEGEYLFANQGGSIEGAEHYWEVTLNVEQTGIYEILTTVPTLAKYRFYSVKIMLDEDELYSETNANPSYNSDIPQFNEKTVRRYLEAGSYKYRFYVGKGTGGNQQLYLDALKIKPVSTGSSDPDATGFYFGYEAEVFADTPVSVSYTYQGTNPEGSSVLRLMYKDGTEWKVGETKTVSGGTGEIVLSDSLVGKEVKVEFYPVDNTGVMGPLFSENIGVLQRAIYISPTLTKNTTSSRYEASVDIEFNSLTMPLPQVLIIIAQYDANGAMVGYTPLYVDDMARNYSRTKTLNAPFASGATSATLFVWSGTSVTGTVDKAYTDTVTQ